MASLLILTQPLQFIIPTIPKVLQAASIHARKRLYIHLDQLSLKQSSEKFGLLMCRSRLISKIYSTSSVHCPGVDIRVLMNGFKQNDVIPHYMKSNLENVLIDCISNPSELSLLERRYKGLIGSKTALVLLKNTELNSSVEEVYVDYELQTGEKVYRDVAVGGTFDRLHPGHKILLSEAVLRTLKRLTVGVADGPLLKSKVLKEFILPFPERIEHLREFLQDIDQYINYNLVKLEDICGPTADDPDMEMIVVSEETKKAVGIINDHRKRNGLNKLESYCIKIFEDCQKASEEEEDKFSSSSQRMRMLGTRLRPVKNNQSIPSYPYIIGLTGGSASGKTNVCRRLQEMGAGVIDCDRLGHKAYECGTNCYNRLVDLFGKDILNEDKQINRKVLGDLVFNDKAKLKQLTDIVWPAIASLAKEETETLTKAGKKVVVFDAALLLEAEWDAFCHEVWVCVIEEEEAVRRITERDGISRDAALQRIRSQQSNEYRVAKAHVVFCTLWSPDYTRTQVEKACHNLRSESKL